MTREQLESYRSMKEEIAEFQYKLQHLADGDALVGNDVIMDYRSGYPVPQPVVGYDYEKYIRMKEHYQEKILKMQEETKDVEEFVEKIPDSLTRRIFRMKYIDGLSQQEIAARIHMDRSSISKKISGFLKVSHNSHNSRL
ncbi:MAG: hypothetical protein NC331_11375 [Lachnospiraceae bacterium]|nr:hypothetical protein [Lachnospiraceae bacterium]MCM1239968.1 hypothetical protein [Lachnospiraceae bacterium]